MVLVRYRHTQHIPYRAFRTFAHAPPFPQVDFAIGSTRQLFEVTRKNKGAASGPLDVTTIRRSVLSVRPALLYPGTDGPAPAHMVLVVGTSPCTPRWPGELCA